MMSTTLTRAHLAVERLFQATSEEVTRGHQHMLVGVITNVGQTILLVGVFYMVSVLSGFGTAMIRGDLLIYLITGVFLFNLHVKSVGAILASSRAAGKARQTGFCRPRRQRSGVFTPSSIQLRSSWGSTSPSWSISASIAPMAPSPCWS